MKERIITGAALFFLVAVAILTKIIVGTTIIVDVIIGGIAILCAFEISTILKNQKKNNHQWVIASFPLALFVLIYLEFTFKLNAILSGFLILGLFVLFLFISFFITLLTHAKTENEMREFKIRTSKSAYAFSKGMNTLLGCLYPTFLIMLIMPLNHLAEINYIFGGSIANVSTISIILVCLCFLVPFICDTFAYLIGKAIGGPKLCPKISPNKTISGAIGGIVTTILLLIVLYVILSSIPSTFEVLNSFGFTWWNVALFGLVASVACELGDLLESYLKRKAEMKDSSNLLPGHGGMFDRVDGLTFVVPVVIIFALII